MPQQQGDKRYPGYRRPASYYREIVFGLRAEPYGDVQLRAEAESSDRLARVRSGWPLPARAARRSTWP
jgi:hypothetical protein